MLPKDDVRPVTSRALKSLLDTLRPQLFQSEILDLYAGKGRFGLGCLKEGALKAVFVERKKIHCDEIIREGNLYKGKIFVDCEDSFKFLTRAIEKGYLFDLIFADPPFSYWQNDFFFRLWNQVKLCLRADSIFLVKCPKKVLASLEVSDVKVRKKTVIGDSAFLFISHDGQSQI